MSRSEEEWQKVNIEYYASTEARQRYVDHARDGLTPSERRIIDDHFTDRSGTVLDLGCGAGRTTAMLDAMGFDVVGVDVSEELIETGRNLFPGVEFRRGDATDLQFESESFDYVLFSGMGIDDIVPESDRLAALREVRRTLKPEGRFAFDVHNAWYLYLVWWWFPFLPDRFRPLVRFWTRNVENGMFGSPYKLYQAAHGWSKIHFTTPKRQKRQLADLGFEVLEVYTDNDRPERLSPSPYYLCRKQ